MTPAKLDLTLTRGITFGPIVVNCYADTANTVPVNLTGYSVFAQVRATPTSLVTVLDLQPAITNAAAGQITFPEIDYNATFAMTPGACHWDLVLLDSLGKRIGPLVKGNFTIASINTQPPATS